MATNLIVKAFIIYACICSIAGNCNNLRVLEDSNTTVINRIKCYWISDFNLFDLNPLSFKNDT